MSYKNTPEKDRPSFGKKLFSLMQEKNIDTPRQLATDLYDKKLVSVSTRDIFSDDFQIRSNAIGSIEKKIRKHLNSENPSCLQGEFLLAYCKYFEVSSDYLLGFTNIHSNDISVREICEKTGLNEKSVKKFVNEPDEFFRERNAAVWNVLMNSAFDEMVDVYYAYSSELSDYWYETNNALFLHILLDKGKQVLDDDTYNENSFPWEEQFKDAQASISSHHDAMAGLLFKFSRIVTNAIEDNLKWPDDLVASAKRDAEKRALCMLGLDKNPK